MGDLLLREICELTGVTRRAVQGYEKECLVKPTSKNKQGYGKNVYYLSVKVLSLATFFSFSII